jgi:hypothetical protein
MTRYLVFIPTLIYYMNACAQSDQAHTRQPHTFVGSTPCNPDVNAAINIPRSDVCAFMKWKLQSAEDNTFTLSVSYGDYKPNTTLFAGGGKSLMFSGTVEPQIIERNHTSYKILKLTGHDIRSPIRLLLLDRNVLHFIDSNNQLVRGDASQAFILNRVEQVKH